MGENIISLISSGSEYGGFSQEAPLYPQETGSSSIARVLAVGKGVTGFHSGDLIFHGGHHTRYAKLSAPDAVLVPAGAKVEHAIFGRYAAVSMTSIYRMKARPSDQIIVTGLGMVGLMCAAVLQTYGFTVYGVDPIPERQCAVTAAGIRYVGESLQALGAQNQSCGALMECSGNENALSASIPYLRKGAEAFQIGVPWHRCSDWSAHDLLYKLFYGYISVHGGWEWSLPLRNDDFHVHSAYGHIESAMRLIADGKILVPDVMYELRDPRECSEIYPALSISGRNAVSTILDWRMLRE